MKRTQLRIRLNALLAGFLFTWVLAITGRTAAADSEAGVDGLFQEAAQALERGAFSEALVRLERLSDRGFLHPDVSFNRGLGYLQRAESAQAQAGDWGQAVAAWREAATLTDDAEAERLIVAARQEISRRRAARGRDPVVIAPPLGRAVSSLLSVSTWAVLAMIASLVLAAALFQRVRVRSTHRLAASIVASVSGGLLVVFGSLYALAYHYATTSQEAVVIVEQATLRDQTGKPLLARALDTPSGDVPEGAVVFVLGRAGRLIQVQWGGSQAWLRDTELRWIARPGS